MTDFELKDIIQKSREFPPDPNNLAKPGKAKIYPVPYFPAPRIVKSPETEPAQRTPYNSVEFELVQIGRNKFEWEYKRYIQE